MESYLSVTRTISLADVVNKKVGCFLHGDKSLKAINYNDVTSKY